MRKKVVVTGASGHLGYHVAKHLLQKNFEVTILIRRKNENTEKLKVDGASVHFANLHDPATFEDSLKNADALFHLASENTIDTRNEERVLHNTIDITKSVLQTALKQQVKTIIYTSSVVVLGRSPNPKRLINESDIAKGNENPYTLGKSLSEKYCDELIVNNDIDIRRLYPSWVVGSDDQKLTPPHTFIEAALHKKVIPYCKGGISIASVDEVALAHVNAWLQGEPNGKYILGGKNISFKELYLSICHARNKKAILVYIPKIILLAGSYLAKTFIKNSNISPSMVKAIVGKYSWYDSGKAIKELGYKIPPVETSIKEALLNIDRKKLLVNKLIKKETQTTPIEYEPNDVLLITGVPGLLGSRMVDVFMNGDRDGNYSLKRKVRLLVEPRHKGLLRLPDNFEIVYANICDYEAVKIALKNVIAVYHLAGIIHPSKTKLLYQINFEGTKNIVDACIENGVKRILYMSTDSVCGFSRDHKPFTENEKAEPYKDYGRSKYLAEEYIFDKTREGKIEGTCLRGFWFFGTFLPERNLNFYKMFLWKRQIVFGNGKNLRSTTHVDNIVQAFVKAEKKQATIGKWYWIADNDTSTVRELYKGIASALQVPFRPIYIANWMCKIFSVVDSFLSSFGRLNATVHAAGKFYRTIAGDSNAAKRDFGYKPSVGKEETLQEIADLKEKIK